MRHTLHARHSLSLPRRTLHAARCTAYQFAQRTYASGLQLLLARRRCAEAGRGFALLLHRDGGLHWKCLRCRPGPGARAESLEQRSAGINIYSKQGR